MGDIETRGAIQGCEGITRNDLNFYDPDVEGVFYQDEIDTALEKWHSSHDSLDVNDADYGIQVYDRNALSNIAKCVEHHNGILRYWYGVDIDGDDEADYNYEQLRSFGLSKEEIAIIIEVDTFERAIVPGYVSSEGNWDGVTTLVEAGDHEIYLLARAEDQKRYMHTEDFVERLIGTANVLNDAMKRIVASARTMLGD